MKNANCQRFVGVLLFAVSLMQLTATVSPVQAAQPRRPNVILIMADDLGYECIGANGGTSYKTPTLDKLAATGVRFTHCFVQPLCTPTRVQLMTGIYNVRNYLTFGQMDPAAITFGNLFQQAGYATCIAGKWQLGRDPNLPKTFGFDEHCLWQHTRRPDRYRNPGLEINGIEKDFSAGEYGPDIVNDYVLNFIERKKSNPFFLYYPMMLTHAPYDATPDSPDYDGSGKTKKRDRNPHGIDEHFADMVAYMDKLIGKLVVRLVELGLRDNTLILFMGDNGTGAGTRSTMGDRVVIGGKGQTTHLGMHVPLVASWPGKFATGIVRSELVDSTDFLPTICEAAGIDVPSQLAIDGHSFLSQLRGELGNPRQWYYCWYAPRDQFVGEFAANHRYKLYRNTSFFDLANDADEKQPLEIDTLQGEAASAAKLLQNALDRYTHARPAHLPNSTVKARRKGKK